MAKIMVTGVNGFVGKHLASELASAEHQTIGVGLNESANPLIADLVEDYYQCDLTREDQVSDLPLDDIDAVISLAGLAAVGPSFDYPEKYMQVNVDVLRVISERLKEIGETTTRVVAISSGAVYDNAQPMPLTEESSVDPDSSPYAASKIAMEREAKRLSGDGVDIVVARPFNHIGPNQEPGFLLPDLYQQMVESEDGTIRVGNLTTKRDFTDVRDVSRAYIMLATSQSLTHEIYNVCSGRALQGTEILSYLKAACDRPELEVVVDKSKFRPSDAPILFGDNGRIHEDTGWQPKIPIKQTIKDVVVKKH